MNRKILLLLIMSGFVWTLLSLRVQAQSGSQKFEVSGVFSVLDLNRKTTFTQQVQCVRAPCPNLIYTSSQKAGAGVGGRLGYRVSEHLTLESEINLFPHHDIFAGGNKLEGLFGAKIGRRYDKYGLFAKARPGFLLSSKGGLKPRPNSGCVAVFPAPLGCYLEKSTTDFAMDLGAVFEFYPTEQMIVRFDGGDTIMRGGRRVVAVPFPPFGAAITAPEATTHNFQGSLSVGFRF